MLDAFCNTRTQQLTNVIRSDSKMRDVIVRERLSEGHLRRQYWNVPLTHQGHETYNKILMFM